MIKYWYWFLPITIFVFQFLFTLNTFGQIRYEELAESVRNVYWLEQKTIYDGISSNVGWYGTQALLYKTFGFALNNTKYFRVFLQLISLLCLAMVLKKYLGDKKARIPLLAIGLSPTLLYFNTLQTSYGTDLQYFPITLYLITTLDFKKKWQALIKQFLLGAVSMIAWMSYPTFVFYLPILGLVYLWQLKNQMVFKNLFALAAKISLTLVSFALPFFLALIYLKDKQLFVYDAKTGGGIFRGAGNFYPDLGIFFSNFFHTLGDLFGAANSYYFEVKATDFSYSFPIFTILLSLVITLILIFKKSKFKYVCTLAWFLLLSNIIISSLTFDPSGFPGIRRNTGALVAFYALFTISWYFTNSQKFDPPVLKTLLITVLFILPLHHLIVFPINYTNLTTHSPYRYSHIFGVLETPQKSLDLFVAQALKEDLKLGCKDQTGTLKTCRYPETFAAVAGACLWNNLPCKNILGYDEKVKDYIPLNINLWETYYWDH